MVSKSQSKSFTSPEKRIRKVFVRTTVEEREALKEIAKRHGYNSMSTWMRDRGLKPMLDVSIAMQDQEDKG
jgi:hypothetical protein